MTTPDPGFYRFEAKSAKRRNGDCYLYRGDEIAADVLAQRRANPWPIPAGTKAWRKVYLANIGDTVREFPTMGEARAFLLGYCAHMDSASPSAKAEASTLKGRARLEAFTLTAPSHWACYLINGDASGMDDSEIAACDAWIKREGLGAPVSCDDAGFIAWHDARQEAPFAADCQGYTFLADTRAKAP